MKIVFLSLEKLKFLMASSLSPLHILFLIGLPVMTNLFLSKSLNISKAEHIKLACFANHRVVRPGNEFCSYKINGIVGLRILATKRGIALA